MLNAQWHNRLHAFFISVSGILFVTGCVKLLTAAESHTVLLNAFNPVIGVSERTVFIVTGLLEIVLALAIVVIRHIPAKLAVVSLFVTEAIMYRIISNSVAHSIPCPCLGNAYRWLHISPATADVLALLALAYMLIGCFLTLCIQVLVKRG